MATGATAGSARAGIGDAVRAVPLAARAQSHSNDAPSADAEEQPGGGGRGDPARRRGACVDGRAPKRPDDAAGKADDARGAAHVLEPARDLLLLRAQPLGREHRVGFGVARRRAARP